MPNLHFYERSEYNELIHLFTYSLIHLFTHSLYVSLITEKFWVTLFAQNFSHIIKLYLIYPSILSEIFLFTPVSTASFATLTAFLIA